MVHAATATSRMNTGRIGRRVTSYEKSGQSGEKGNVSKQTRQNRSLSAGDYMMRSDWNGYREKKLFRVTFTLFNRVGCRVAVTVGQIQTNVAYKGKHWVLRDINKGLITQEVLICRAQHEQRENLLSVGVIQRACLIGPWSCAVQPVQRGSTSQEEHKTESDHSSHGRIQDREADWIWQGAARDQPVCEPRFVNLLALLPRRLYSVLVPSCCVEKPASSLASSNYLFGKWGRVCIGRVLVRLG